MIINEIITRLRAADPSHDAVSTITAQFTAAERDEVVRLLMIARDNEAYKLSAIGEAPHDWTPQQKAISAKVSCACNGHSYEDVIGVLVIMTAYTLQAQFGPGSMALAMAIHEFTDNVIDMINQCPQPMDPEGTFHG